MKQIKLTQAIKLLENPKRWEKQGYDFTQALSLALAVLRDKKHPDGVYTYVAKKRFKTDTEKDRKEFEQYLKLEHPKLSRDKLNCRFEYEHKQTQMLWDCFIWARDNYTRSKAMPIKAEGTPVLEAFEKWLDGKYTPAWSADVQFDNWDVQSMWEGFLAGWMLTKKGGKK